MHTDMAVTEVAMYTMERVCGGGNIYLLSGALGLPLFVRVGTQTLGDQILISAVTLQEIQSHSMNFDGVALGAPRCPMKTESRPRPYEGEEDP